MIIDLLGMSAGTQVCQFDGWSSLNYIKYLKLIILLIIT